MDQSSRKNRPLIFALYANALLLGAILIVMLSRLQSPTFATTAFGADGAPLSPQPIAGGGGIFLMPAQFSTNVWGCYIMDIDRQTLCAYTMSGSPPTLRLAASRNFRYDRELKRYNTENPSPDDVRRLVEKETEDSRVRTTQPAAPPAEAGEKN